MSDCIKQKVVIIGVSYSSRLALARSIGVLGYDITVILWESPIRHINPIDAKSKYVSRVLYCPKKEGDFIRLLMEKCVDENRKVILLPDCDFSVTVIDSHLNELRPYFLMPNINQTQGAIVTWSDKMKQKAIASSIGMNVASATTIEITDGKYSIPAAIQYPCYPKALTSVSGGKAGMCRCDSQSDLEHSLNTIIKRKMADTKVLVEDYMQIDEEYAAVGFSDGHTVSIPGVFRFVVGSQTHKGIALQGEVLPLKGFERIIEQFKSFILQCGLCGLFDIDFYRCRGKLYFSELNLRYGGSGYAIVKMGINLPKMFVESMMGAKLNEWDKQVQTPAVYMNEKMGLDDLRNGLIKPSEYRCYVRSSDVLFIHDLEDENPYKAFRKMVNKEMVLYWGKSLLRRMKG